MFFRVIGKMGNNMGREYIKVIIKKRERGYGRMGRG